MKFNWDKILQPNTAVHCPEKQMAENICKEADGRGLKWGEGSSYLTHNNWLNHRDKTCYNFYSGNYGATGYGYIGYTVLHYNDVLLNRVFIKRNKIKKY